MAAANDLKADRPAAGLRPWCRRAGNSYAMSRLLSFVGGDRGPWRVRTQTAVRGVPLVPVRTVSVLDEGHSGVNGHWCLRGIGTEDRYLRAGEKRRLQARQEMLGRAGASCAALIPIRKRADWWSLPQARRREIIERDSRHIATGLEYLPAIARRLLHSRDLSEHEPFDFLTWFEFEPSQEAAFDELLARLRASPEWDYVDREVELRLECEPG